MVLFSLVKWFGVVVCAWLVCLFMKFVVALTCSCDFQTAITPNLPKNAFQDEVVWITGAGSGIGKEIALLLVSQNDSIYLILSSRTVTDLQSVQHECLKLNPNAKVKILPIDLSANLTELQTRAQQAMTQFFGVDKPITVLINNAGLSTRGMATESTPEADAFVANVNYLSHVAITKSILACSNNSQQKNYISKLRIVNTLSVCSLLGYPSRTAYCGAKFALKGWMDAFRIECLLQHHNVHVLNVCLGSTYTNNSSRAVVNVINGKVETNNNNNNSENKTTNAKNKGDVQQEKEEKVYKKLSAKMVAERMLSTLFHEHISECWLAKGYELVDLYLNQYVPQMAFEIVLKSSSKQFATQLSKSKSA